MKSTVFLLILLAALCGWYFYDKYEKNPFRPKTEIVQKEDPRYAEINAAALKLYPTNASARKAWAAVECRALSVLNTPPSGISKEIDADILKRAEKNYGKNYDKQLQFVLPQRAAAAEVVRMMSFLPFSVEESNMITDAARKSFDGDYVAQRAMISEITDAYAVIKGKGITMKPEDFAKLRAKIMPMLVSVPREAVKTFDVQFLARHNYITKKIPESYGDLREGIETLYPDDYIAQLRELDVRLDAANARGKRVGISTMAANAVTDLCAYMFSKYIYVCDADDTYYGAAFIELNGKKLAVVPFAAVDGRKKVSLVLGNEKVSTEKIYICKGAMFALAEFADNTVFSVSPATDNPEKYCAGTRVEIVGFNKGGGRMSIDAALAENHKLQISDADARRFNELLQEGAFVVAKDERVIVGFLDRLPPKRSNVYSEFSDPNVKWLLGEKRRYEVWWGLKQLVPKIKDDIAETASEFRVARLSNLADAEVYYADKYKSQYDRIKALCRANYGLLSFMIYGTFADDCQNPVVKATAEKFKQFFIKGSRVNEKMVFMKFGEYADAFYASVSQPLRPVRDESFGKDFYYPIRTSAIAQRAAYLQISEVFRNAIVKQPRREILHSDIAASIVNGTYIPPGRDFSRPASGGGGGAGVIRMSN